MYEATMERKKPKLKLEDESCQKLPLPGAASANPPTTADKSTVSAIRLPETADQLTERRKPQLIPKSVAPENVLPFKVTSEPLPAPRADAFPQPHFPGRVEEEHFVNKGALQTEDEKAKQIFTTNHLATYGKVSAEEINAAYAEHQTHRALAKRLSKNHDERSHRFRQVFEMPTWLHLIFICGALFVFALLRTKAEF